jgi:hypothetical protein
MSYDERHLAELLRLLPPAPEALVARAMELPMHFDDDAGAFDADDGDDSDGTDTPGYHDDHMTPHDLDPGDDVFDNDDDDDSPDDWG